MQPKLNFLSCLLFALSLIGCEKEENINSDDPGKVSQQLIGSWKLTAKTADPALDFNGDGTLDTDIYALYSSCEQDQRFTFNEGGTGSVKHACEPERPMVWKYLGNSGMLGYDFNPNVDSINPRYTKLRLVEVSSTYFILRYTEIFNNIRTGRKSTNVTSTFTRQ